MAKMVDYEALKDRLTRRLKKLGAIHLAAKNTCCSCAYCPDNVRSRGETWGRICEIEHVIDDLEDLINTDKE